MKNPKITIAMTSYNTAKFIKAAIQSIVTQDYKNWELIIVDDASKDKTLKVASNCVTEYKIGKKVKFIKHDKNYGYGRSLRDSIAGGDGELVAVVDSDDVLSRNDAFTIMVRSHIKNPKAVLCYSTYYLCTTVLRRDRVRKISAIPKGETYLSCLKKRFKEQRVSHLKVFKRSFYNKTEGVNPTLFRSIDKDLVLKLEEVGKLVYIPLPLYIRRRRTGCLTSSFRKRPRSYRKKVRRDKAKFIKDAQIRRGLI